MDPILTKFGDVTIQRLEKPKEPKPGPSAEPPAPPKPKAQFEEDETDETISLKRSFPDSQISIKKFKLDAGSVTLEKKIQPPQTPQPQPQPQPPKDDVQQLQQQQPSRVSTPKKSPSLLAPLDDLSDKQQQQQQQQQQQRKYEDDATTFSDSEPELSEEFDSDLEDEDSDGELVIPGEAPAVAPPPLPSAAPAKSGMPKANSDDEDEEEDEEHEDDEEEESTSTSFLDKLVDDPFTEPPGPIEQPQKQPENSVDTDDYDFDIKEKLKEMGEISFQTVKKGEKPKKIEISTENEVVVTPARKPGTTDEEGGAERKGGLNLRRNIREVMDETKLDESTLAAQRQEAERLQRVQEQQRLLREFQRQAAQERMQHKVLSLLQGNNFSKPGTSSTTRIGNTVLVKLPNGQTKPMTKLPKRHFDMVRMQKSAGGMGRPPQGGPPMPTGPPVGPHHQMGMMPSHRNNNSIRNLMAMKRHQQQVDANLTPSVSIAPVSKRFMPPMMPRPPYGPGGPGSDSESDEDIKPPMMMRPMMQNKPPPSKDTPVIDISSDEDCILVSEPEADQDDDTEDDPSNSGMHTHDQFNVPDDQGRVVVNIGHPDDEPDIFVAPQIARIIKPHQIGGVRFLYDNVVESRGRFTNSSGFGCILAHSMGLGKTLQVVCFSDIFLRHTPGRTILCIMPINTLQNWMAEYNMWLPTEEQLASSPIKDQGEVRPRNFNLHVLNDSHKTLTARHKVIHAWRTAGGVLLIGYEQFRLLSLKKHPKSRRKSHLVEPQDDDKNKKLFDDVHEALVKPGPDLVICDEGHRIKNSHASISQALKQMSTKRRVVLTGYPLQNNLMEYWCMVDFVRPNYLGTKTEFCNMFERPIMNGQCIDSTETDIKLMRYRAHVLHSLLVGFVQRRSHTVLHTALPQKNEYVLLVRMTPFQRKLYETFMDVVIRADLTPNPLKAFAVCCKIWNHPDVMYYFLEKRKSRGDAIDIDLEEVAGNSAIAETAAKPKRGPARSRKSSGKAGKNCVKPAASVTPYNSSSEVGQAPPPPEGGGAASSNPLPPNPSATTPNSFSGIVSSQSQPNRTDEPSTTGPPQQSDPQSFPQPQASPYSQQNPASSGGYYDQQQQQQNSQNQYPSQQQQQPNFNKPTQGTPNYDPEYNSPQSSFNQTAPKTNFLNSFPQESSNFMENMANNTQNSNLDFINNISDNSQYHPQSQTSTNYNRDAPQNFDLNFSQNNFQNYHHQQQNWEQQQQQSQQNWGQQPSQQPQNDQYNQQQQQQQSEYYNNCNPPNQYNSGFGGGESWVKKEEPKSEPPSTPMSVKSDNSNDSTKPKINIISDIKLPPVFGAPDKKIKILSDIKIEPKPEDLGLDEKLKIEEKQELEDSLLAKKDQISSSEIMSATKSTACRADMKEDNGIPYDWATELLKDYVPGIIENSAKMQILFCILNESILLGDRLLVFSQSLITLDLIEQFLQMSVIPDGDNQKWARNTSYYRLDGSTSALEREKLINEFNSNPKIHLFLVSTRAGSLGINLIGANRVVVLDASWNPCHDTQAVCRVYRYGQRKPCFVYRLVVDNCLEKKIYDRQINKQGMSDRVVDECNPDAHLTMKDVSTLCWDDKANEGEEQDYSHLRDTYIDTVLQKVIERHSRRFTKQPFQHESLLVDRKEKQLSQQEKRLAKKGYEREKQASRQPSYNLLTAGRGHRPVASVRPMQQDSLNARPNRWIPAEHWQRQGMTAQEMTLPLDVVIPTNQPEKGSIVLKAGQKVLVLKSPKGVYMQLESGKIVAIKTAIKVKGKAEDNHDPTANMLPKLPPPPPNAMAPMMKVHPNQAAGMPPQKKIVKPFTPGVAKMNVRSVRQSVPNLVSRIQSVTKKDPVTGKVRSFQTGADAIKALQQKDHEVVPGSSSDEEHHVVQERGKGLGHNSNLDIVLPHNSNQNTAEDFSKRYSLLKKSVSIRRLPPNQQAAQQQQQEQMQQLKQMEQKRISTLQQLEQATTSITDNTPFQETLDSITSSYKDDNIEDDAASMASSSDPKPAQIPSDASDQSDEVTYVSEHHPAQQQQQSYQQQQQQQQQAPTNVQQSSQDSIKSDVSQSGSNAAADYGGYNYNYNYNQPMQPYHAPPPPPQGYGYPQQHPPPYDPMMGGYASQPPPQYNYGYQGYHPPPPPQPQYPPPPPPQSNYDYNAVPPQQPMYSGYHNPYPQQYAPPPPQAMYPPPPTPANPPTYPDASYQYPTLNAATSSTPYYPNA